jgi:hypothetical protein
MVKMAYRFLTYIDIFGYEPNLEIKKSKSFKTPFGGILSILILITILYVIWFFGNEIIFKRKPSLITTIYNDANPLRINLTDDNFIVALGLQNPDYSGYINESIYYLDVQHITMLRKDGITTFETIDIKTIPCNQKNITLLPDYFSQVELNNLYCIRETNTYMKGDFGQSVWSYLQFSFKRCKNSTENNNHCKSEDEISRRLDGGYFGLFVSDTNIDTTNINSPAIKYGKNLFTTFSVRAYRDFWMYVKNIEVNSDLGWLMEDIHQEFYFSIDSYRETWDYRDTSGGFFNFVLRPSNNRQVFNRSYLKAQILAANIGGIIKFLLICGEILSYYFTRLRYREYLTSIFFNNNLIKSGPIKNDKIGVSELAISSTKRFKLVNSQSNINTKKNVNNVFAYNKSAIGRIQVLDRNNNSNNKDDNMASILNNKSKIEIKRFSLCQMFRSVIFLKNTKIKLKEKMLKQAFGKLEIYFDWVHLIKGLMEFEIMKSYVFDERQLKILSCLKNYKENRIEVIFYLSLRLLFTTVITDLKICQRILRLNYESH